MPINWKSGRLQAAKLRHRIDLVTVSPVQDSTGGIDLSQDVVYANVWAAVEPLSGSESESAGSQMSVGVFQVVLRYIGAAPSWQALFAYTAKSLVKDSNGYLQQAQAGGVSGAVAPTWNMTAGNITADGDPSTGLNWKNLGPAPPFTGVTSAMQMWWQSRQFQIVNVSNPDGRTKMLCLTVVEINDSRQQLTSQPSGLL